LIQPKLIHLIATLNSNPPYPAIDLAAASVARIVRLWPMLSKKELRGFSKQYGFKMRVDSASSIQKVHFDDSIVAYQQDGCPELFRQHRAISGNG